MHLFRLTRRAGYASVLLSALLGVSLLLGPLDRGADAGRPTYTNPVFARDFPDPSALRVGNIYYAYGTSTDWEAYNRFFPILRSTDLVHWRSAGDAMTSAPGWGVGDWWAPDVIARHGVYYMYYVGHSLAQNEHCVAVATSASPTGPFTHRAVIGCGDSAGQGYIDPAPFIDDNGAAYLYVSVDNPYHSISVIPLKADLIHAADPRRELFTLSQAWEHGPAFSTVEGPYLVKHAGRYYLFYSGNDWQHDYAMGYAVADSPLGPFAKYAHNPILRGNARVTGPGGGSLIQGPHGGWWLLYHAWSGGPGYNVGGVRNLRLDPVLWRGAVVSVAGPSTTPRPAP